MATNQNFEQSERKSGNKAARGLRDSFRSKIASAFKKRSGDMEKSNVVARYKDGRLDRLVLLSPHYSFKNHFGSTKTGATPRFRRDGANVRSFQRFLGGGMRPQQVNAHHRGGGAVKSHHRNIDYKAYNHISEALKATNSLQVLATELGENRIVLITSQIEF